MFDLPGHGRSEAPQYSVTNKLMAELVEALSCHLGLSTLTVCGLNNGGSLALHTVAARYILIDPIIEMDAAFVTETKHLLEQWDKDQEACARAISEAVLPENCNKEREIAFQAFSQVKKRVFRELLEDLLRDNSVAAYQNLCAPSLLILTDEHHCKYKTVAGQNMHGEVGKVIGSKSWPTLQEPLQVNAMIADFMSQ